MQILPLLLRRVEPLRPLQTLLPGPLLQVNNVRSLLETQHLRPHLQTSVRVRSHLQTSLRVRPLQTRVQTMRTHSI
jgi:hypothetical protein